MKAIVYKEFGPPDVLRLEEIPSPGENSFGVCELW
jgi:hypothetical protein